MTTYIKKIVKRLALKPNNIFLIDGIGALVTAVLLIAVLWYFIGYIGMPRVVISLLSVIAFIFAGYSFCCYVFLCNSLQKRLAPIIVGNIAYSISTFALVIYFYNSLTLAGLTYFTVEILLISLLVYIEIMLLKTIDERIGL